MGLERESPLPFLFSVKSDPASPALQPECGSPSCLTHRLRLITPRGGKAVSPAVKYRLNEQRILDTATGWIRRGP